MDLALPHVDGVEHRFVDLPGPMRVHVAEAGHGEPVLLLHGWPQHWYCWREVAPALAAHYRVLMPDLRGFGWSDAPGWGYDAPTFAADVVALLDALEIDRVKLVGHDWGGFTAFLLGLEYPGRIERILVCNAPHPWAPLSGRTLLSLWRTWYVALNAMPGLGSAVVARPGYVPWFLGLGGRRHVWSAEDGARFAERFADPARARASSVLYRYYLRVAVQIFFARRFDQRRLTVPTRLVFGTDDFFIPTAYLTAGESHGEDFLIELVPGCGHFMPEERPDLVVQRALGFFAEAGIA